MKLAFLVNDLTNESPNYTTTRLSRIAAARGHEVYYLDIDQMEFLLDEKVHGYARIAPAVNEDVTNAQYLARIRNRRPKPICVSDLDIMMLRYNPADEELAWRESVPLDFANLAVRNGVMVGNHPESLQKMMNKLYGEWLPQPVQPKGIVSPNPRRIKEFIKEMKGNAVLKPLQGSGGDSVFRVIEHSRENVNQMIETILKRGPCVVQEYLPDAVHGDIRMFMWNGKPYQVDGHIAAFRRISTSGDMRSNRHVGGEAAPAELDDVHMGVAEMVGPKLIADGLGFVGLDIVGDKVMEANVFSPGGLGSAEAAYSGQGIKVDFRTPLIESLERRAKILGHYRDGHGLDNRILNVLDTSA